MLLVCVGPDTYRAVQRARQLEAAFREKHDPQGTAVEHLTPGKAAVEEVVEHASAASLFQPRRFLRADGLVSMCPKAKRELLAKALQRDTERTIVVCVEEKPLDKEALKWLSAVPETHVYDYPLLQGKAFQTWLNDQARSLGAVDPQALANVAMQYEGDGWSAMSELSKLVVSGDFNQRAQEPSEFEQTDRVLFGGRDERRRVILKEGPGLLNLVQYQYRSFLRVVGGESKGLHPYVVKKLSRGKADNADRRFSRTLIATLLERNGLSKSEEIGLILDDK